MGSCNSYTNKIYINFNLVFDYNSLLFCVLRSYLLPYGFNIQNKTRHLYELKLPSEAYQSIPKDSLSDKCSEKEFFKILLENFLTIKPIIGAIETIQYLNENGIVIVLYTNLPKELLKTFAESHSSWFGNNKIVHYDDLKQIWSEANTIVESDITLQQHFSLLNKSMNAQKTFVYIKNQQFHDKIKKFEIDGCFNFLKWEDIKWQQVLKQCILPKEIAFPAPEYFLKLKETPSSKALIGFKISKKLSMKVNCQSKVIRGDGKAAKELGIPTANLEVNKDIENKINNLLTGVYAGTA